ncbi:YbaN family protein [uncultured Sphingomonas sp.]|uniref:YbaN family protein n=1 Tax=uncultured Sphingomonas sp. TaxID=158754 RepID=UPI0025E5209B|nr:YbaN family protein [uncultured Sphingomonas sp.]
MPALRNAGGNGRLKRFARVGWLSLGIFCVALGIVGALLPLMPTTIFLILAAACFARSSPRLERWLLDHPRCGPTLRAWRRDGAMSRRAKAMAVGGMATGYAIFFTVADPPVGVFVVAALIMSACAVYIYTRPVTGNKAAAGRGA